MFNDQFIEDLPEDLKEATWHMCTKFKERDSMIPSGSEIGNYDDYLKAYAAIETGISILSWPCTLPELGDNKDTNITCIRNFVETVFGHADKMRAADVLSSTRSKFKAKFGVAFFYRFSDGDLKRIQALINELRGLIRKSELFDAKHKERILTKLEKLQLELHKQMSSLDKFWGLIGEAGVVLGKFGRDAKPLVDRIREIAQIIWRTQAISEELPSGTSLPLLSDGEPKE